ncbi:MAG TPA: DUF3775 domain-containing protein [Burkholderiales bacterium]|nr:DUF3775 domain-containing protein [Burkholderiales bacterium]
MLNVNPQIVCLLIERAREFHTKQSASISEEAIPPTVDVALDVLAPHQEDPTFVEFKAVVDDLEPDQQVALVALMWVGRGDFEPDEWRAAFKQAGEGWTPHTAEYLLATPLVADYLDEGLTALGYSCEE